MRLDRDDAAAAFVLERIRRIGVYVNRAFILTGLVCHYVTITKASRNPGQNPETPTLGLNPGLDFRY